jgi:hypothetical protein
MLSGRDERNSGPGSKRHRERIGRAHDLADESVHRSRAALELAATEDLGAGDIPGFPLGPATCAELLVRHARRAVRRQGLAVSRWRASILVFSSAEMAEWRPFERRPRRVPKDRAGVRLCRQVRVAREDPSCGVSSAAGASLLSQRHSVALARALNRNDDSGEKSGLWHAQRRGSRLVWIPP